MNVRLLEQFQETLGEHKDTYQAVQAALIRLLSATDGLESSLEALQDFASNVDLPPLLQSLSESETNVFREHVMGLVESSSISVRHFDITSRKLLRELERQVLLLNRIAMASVRLDVTEHPRPAPSADHSDSTDREERAMHAVTGDGPDDGDGSAERRAYNRTWQCDQCGSHFRWQEVKECPECGVPWTNFR